MERMKKKTYLVFSFIWSVIRPFKWLLVGQITVCLFWAINFSLNPYLLKVIFNSIPESIGSKAYDPLITPILTYLCAFIFIACISRYYDWMYLKLYPNLRSHISSVLIDRALDHSHHYYQSHSIGNLINKINDLIYRVPSVVSIFIHKIFQDTLALLIAVYTVWYVHPKFAIGLVIWILTFLIVSVRLSLISRKLSSFAAETHAVVIGNIVDTLSNILSVRLFTGNRFEKEHLSKPLKSSVQADQGYDRFFLKLRTFQDFSFLMFQGVCLWWLIAGLQTSTVSAGDFILILTLNISIVACLQGVSNDIRSFTESIGYITQALDTLYKPIEIQDRKNIKPLVVKKAEILFEDVKFHYKDVPFTFDYGSIRIQSGEKIGLVGFSGSGKTTFVNLILRLFDITDGKILIDQQDIRFVTQHSLREVIAYIPQEAPLFNRSILENIRYGRRNASEMEVMEVAKKAEAHDFISALPQGYYTLIGEKGVQLSGGERQRIMISRAILKNAPILIIDEATSQLDPITECLIQEKLWELIAGKTTLAIAHRLSTVINMDRIFVFDNGRIVQEGSHEELLNREGLYKTLWEVQSEGVQPHVMASQGFGKK